MNKKKGPMPRMCLHCDGETADQIERIAVSQGKTRSAVIRDMLDAGIKACTAGADDQGVQRQLQAAVNETMKPFMERLAAMGAKSTQMAAAAFFLETYVCGLYLPEGDRHGLEEAAVQARQIGAEYLKKSAGHNLDELIRKYIQEDI